MSILLITLSIVVILLGLTFPSNKYVTRIMLIYMWFMFAFNTSNADYINYSGIYSRIGSGTAYTIANYEEGFVLLILFCNRILHLEYPEFIILIATVTTFLFSVVIRLYMKRQNQNIVISLFIITLYWIMICQYRNYIAFLIIMIGLYFYLHRNDKWGTIIYIVTIIGAFLFHRSSILFLLFLLAKHLNIKKCIISVPLLMLPFVFIRSGWLSNLISRYIVSYKISEFIYNDSNRTYLGVFLLVAIRLILLLMVVWISKNDDDIKQSDASNNNDNLLIIKIMILSFSFLAMEAFDANYERLFRVPLFLSIILLAHYKGRHEINIRRVSLQYIGLSGFYLLYMVSFYVSNRSWFYSVLIPVLTNNRLLGT